MKIRTLINPSLVAAGLLLGMTTAVQADSGHISVILHDNDNTYDLGYRYGDYGYCCDGYYPGHRNHGHHHSHHKKQHWHRGHGHYKQHGHHYGYYGGHPKAHGKGRHDGYRDDGHRQDRHRDNGQGKRRHRS